MATVTLTLRGDQIARFVSLSGTGNGAERIVTLTGVQAIGTPDEVFTLEVEQVNAGATEFRNGQFVTIRDADGTVVMPRTNIQPDIEQGLGAGDEHLIIPRTGIFIRLSGTPATPQTVTVTAADEVADPTLGDNDGELDFADVSTAFPCFAEGTLIATPEGDVAAETLSAGDSILTAEGEAARLIWTGSRQIVLTPRPATGELHPQCPILIPAGALGGGVPQQDLIVSPQHRVLLHGAAVEAETGAPEVLAPAKGLLALPRIRPMRGRGRVTYVSLLCERHQVLIANGAPCESFYPGPWIMNELAGEIQAEIVAALHQAGYSEGYGSPARPLIGVRSAERICAALRGHKAPPDPLAEARKSA